MGTIHLNGRAVGDGHPVYIIAEGGLTNWGDLNLAKKQVDAAMAAGCDAIKFQAQTTEMLVSRKVDPYWYRRLKYKELSYDALRELWAYCSVRNIQCFITAHTDVDLDFLDRELNVPFFKVGSGESLNLEFLENAGSRGKPVIMSLGLHLTDEEMQESVRAIERGGCHDIIILHCNTVYPTPPTISDLAMITRLKTMFPYPIGYSDHTVGWHIPIAAVALGATVIEKHLSFDKDDKRSFDCPGSGTPEDWKRIVNDIRDVEAALLDRAGGRISHIEQARRWARQSIVAARDIAEGEVISRDMLLLKRPGVGLGPDAIDRIVGKKSMRAIEADTLIKDGDTAEHG